MSLEKKMLISFDDWIKDLAKENIKLIKLYSKIKDPAKVRKILTIFMKKYVEIVVLDALQETPSGITFTKQELYNFTSKNFASVKYELQNDIAEGFSKALSKYSGMHVDYYCQLIPTPEPINKEMC